MKLHVVFIFIYLCTYLYIHEHMIMFSYTCRRYLIYIMHIIPSRHLKSFILLYSMHVHVHIHVRIAYFEKLENKLLFFHKSLGILIFSSTGRDESKSSTSAPTIVFSSPCLPSSSLALLS